MGTPYTADETVASNKGGGKRGDAQAIWKTNTAARENSERKPFMFEGNRVNERVLLNSLRGSSQRRASVQQRKKLHAD